MLVMMEKEDDMSVLDLSVKLWDAIKDNCVLSLMMANEYYGSL